MRVITGIARGKRLKTLEGIDVRPTTDRVKESIFSIIHFDIEGSRVLDLFSGSGQLGIEALSRGAQSAVFVDSSRQSLEVTKDNLSTTGLSSNARLVNMDSIAFLKGTNSDFDIALLDPPYKKGILTNVLPLLSQKMTDNGIVVCEHEREFSPLEKVGRLILVKTYSYGKIALSLYKIKGEQK